MIDFDRKIVDRDGDELPRIDGKSGPLTLRNLCIAVLDRPLPGDDDLTAARRRDEIASAIHKDVVSELKDTEIELIEGRLLKIIPNANIVGTVHEALANA